MTGRLPASRPGVHRLSVRQSSLTGTLSGVPDRRDTSGRRWPKNACRRMPSPVDSLTHPAPRSRLLRRHEPVRAWPSRRRTGIPLNALIPSTTAPRILPEVVSTTGSPASAAQACRRGRRNAAPTPVDWTRKQRRSRRSDVVMAFGPLVTFWSLPVSVELRSSGQAVNALCRAAEQCRLLGW